MGSSEEAFCLKWNDFQASISSSLGGLLHCRDLQDVTLQCGDQSLQCHRLVLAACSDWFRQIFSTLGASAQLAATRHPVIVVWDAAARDMALLLDFMYHGVVNVKQENLNTFLALAERLSVRGLTQNQAQQDNSSGSRSIISCFSFFDRRPSMLQSPGPISGGDQAQARVQRRHEPCVPRSW